jgi:hypothetical protein
MGRRAADSTVGASPATVNRNRLGSSDVAAGYRVVTGGLHGAQCSLATRVPNQNDRATRSRRAVRPGIARA